MRSLRFVGQSVVVVVSLAGLLTSACGSKSSDTLTTPAAVIPPTVTNVAFVPTSGGTLAVGTPIRATAHFDKGSAQYGEYDWVIVRDDGLERVQACGVNSAQVVSADLDMAIMGGEWSRPNHTIKLYVLYGGTTTSGGCSFQSPTGAPLWDKAEHKDLVAQWTFVG